MLCVSIVSISSVAFSQDKKLTRVEIREALASQEINEVLSLVSSAKTSLASASAIVSTGKTGAFGAKIKKLEEAETYLEQAARYVRHAPVGSNFDGVEQEIPTLQERVSHLLGGQYAGLASALESEGAEATRQAVESTEIMRADEIARMKSKVRQLLKKNNTKEALLVARNLKSLAPSDRAVLQLYRTTRKAMLDVKENEISIAQKNGDTKIWQQIKRERIPDTKLIKYDEKFWRNKVSKRSSSGNVAFDEADTTFIDEALESEVEFIFIDTPFRETLGQLRAYFPKITIVLDQVIKDDVDFDTPVTLRISDMKLKNALRFLVESVGLSYTVSKGAIFISSDERVRSRAVLRIYDVSSIVNDPIGFGHATFAFGGDGRVTVTEPTAEPFNVEILSEFLQRAVDPESWEEGYGSIELYNNQLVVVHTKKVHEKIARILKIFRESVSVQVNIDMAVSTVTRGDYETIQVGFDGLPQYMYQTPTDSVDQAQRAGDTANGTTSLPWYNFIETTFGGGGIDSGGGTDIPRHTSGLFTADVERGSTYNSYIARGYTRFVTRETGEMGGYATSLGQNATEEDGLFLSKQMRIFNELDANIVMHALKMNVNIRDLHTARLTLSNGQQGAFTGITQNTYIGNWELESETTKPVIMHLAEGLILGVTPYASSDMRYVSMDLSIEKSSLVRYRIAQLESTIQVYAGRRTEPDGSIVILYRLEDIVREVQLPIVDIQKIKTSAMVPDGGTLLFGGMKTSQTGKADSGVPIISDLPIVGRLFRAEKQDDEDKVLIVTIKPQLILNSEEERKLDERPWDEISIGSKAPLL